MSYNNPRLTLDMTGMDMILAMSEGNPGAVTVLAEVFKRAASIDPDSALGQLGVLCGLDNLDCYGSRIWMLYKDVCGQNLNHMLGLLRANQLGYVTDREINQAIDGDQSTLDLPALLVQVKERLPRFVMEAA